MTLRIVSKTSEWYILSHAALRTEAVRFFFRESMSPPPTLTEFYPRNPVPSSGIDLGDTHWGFARTGFAARQNLYDFIKPDVWRQMTQARDTSDPEANARPRWIPEAIWQRFMAAGPGAHRYARASRLNTDIILIKNPAISGYADMPTDLEQLRRLLGVIPESTLSQLITGENTDSRRARWMATANESYNRYMWSAVSQHGMGAGQASRSYQNEVYQRFLRAYLPLIGGSFAAHGAGSALGQPGRDAAQATMEAFGWM